LSKGQECRCQTRRGHKKATKSKGSVAHKEMSGKEIKHGVIHEKTDGGATL